MGGRVGLTPRLAIGISLRSPYSQKQGAPPMQEDHQARFYVDYRKVADEYDKEFLQKYDEDLNTTLIFVGFTQNPMNAR
jgi:hypothetical protein